MEVEFGQCQLLFTCDDNANPHKFAKVGPVLSPEVSPMDGGGGAELVKHELVVVFVRFDTLHGRWTNGTELLQGFYHFYSSRFSIPVF